MRTPLIAANWKMNGTGDVLSALGRGIASAAEPLTAVQTILFAPHPYLARVAADVRGLRVEVGAQDVAAEAPGAFTGEVAAEMLVDVGCRWTLVGHSERRTLYGDVDERVAVKVGRALGCGLKVMLCVGETLEEREAGRTAEVVLRQLDAVVDACGVQALVDGAVAYEPVWAIGTGLTATPEQAAEMHAFIRDELTKLGLTDLPILYGGSVKPGNAKDLMTQPHVDGVLVGGASLKLDSLRAID
ncbi:MAG: triose-phosphate isomerase, partial [Gammaproteobacteria bacterium]|nr:triose-phosphate isomerase [Gammaproteobacteria bacterium]